MSVKEGEMIRDLPIERRAVTSEIPEMVIESGILLEELLSGHKNPLSAICTMSLIFGLLLANNMLCHLRVANSTSGRGVLLCIRFHTWISLACIPVICGDIAILAGSYKYLPPVLCGSLDVLTPFLWANISFRGLTIALGR